MLIGQKFNKLTVLEEIGRDKHRHILYKCKCDCGNIHSVTGTNLRNNKVRSCGCLIKETSKGAKPKHGMARTRFYKIWFGMIRRCREKEEYKDVFVENRWLDFLNFKEDMYDSYLKHVELFGEKETTIDRINPFENYYKENCRWATIAEQNRNKKKHYIKDEDGNLRKKDDIGKHKPKKNKTKKIKKATLSKSEIAKKLWENPTYRENHIKMNEKETIIEYKDEILSFSSAKEAKNYLKNSYNLSSGFFDDRIRDCKPYKSKYKEYSKFNGMLIYYKN